MAAKTFIYQIFYDEATRLKLDPGFIPLDNSANPRPDWYELWPIRQFLKNNVLEEGAFYGFLSPKFTEKIGYSSAFLAEILAQCGESTDVFLVPGSWDQIAYFVNLFEQGDVWHPGLMRLTETFFRQIGKEADISRLVTHSLSSTFCNYIIARPAYWVEWLELVDRFFEVVESGSIPELGGVTSYGAVSNQAPMKTFIQERLSSVVLASGRFRVSTVDRSQDAPINPRLFKEDTRTRRQLQACNLLKERFTATGDEEYLRVYYKIRAGIGYQEPVM